MTIGDLIRNEIFSRVANESPDVIERIDAEHWRPFYKKFDQDGRNLFDAYFFPYGLTRRPTLKKSEVYGALRKEWDKITDPAEIVAQLAEYQDAFIDINCGSNMSDHPKALASAFKRLQALGLPTATFPFLMQLSRSAALGEVDEAAAVGMLEVVETFLVRRATCGYEPTGLHAVFKRLWADCDSDFTARKVIGEISKHKTVTWPDRDEFERQIKTRSLYGVGITPYLVIQYDQSLGGDQHDCVPWMEHVLPVNPDPEWLKTFMEPQHLAMKDRLANLLPLSSSMNMSLSNKPYEKKRHRYREDSVFKSTRQFGETIEHWTPDELEARAERLAAWAVTRWPQEQLKL